ncbi:MAG: hypothetical protein ACTHOO_11370 [Alcanivorax sp.]
MSDTVQKVAVLASSTINNDSFGDDGYALGQILAKSDVHIILPGDLDSVKGDVMVGALHEGGDVVNVYTDPGSDPYRPHPANTNDSLLREKTMVEGRKALKKSLDARADVAILMPGGIEELDYAMHMARRGMPLIIVNSDNFYDGLREQMDTVKMSRLSRSFPGNNMDHIHIVSDVDEVEPIIDLYKAVGTPEHDYAQLWSQARAEDRVVRLERPDHAPGFSAHADASYLADEAGVLALERSARSFVEEPTIPLKIDNSTGYYDGLLEQLATYVESGAEKPNRFANVVVTGQDGQERVYDNMNGWDVAQPEGHDIA